MNLFYFLIKYYAESQEYKQANKQSHPAYQQPEVTTIAPSEKQVSWLPLWNYLFGKEMGKGEFEIGSSEAHACVIFFRANIRFENSNREGKRRI